MVHLCGNQELTVDNWEEHEEDIETLKNQMVCANQTVD